MTPSVDVANVDPAPLLVRSTQSGSGFLSQRKRLEYGVTAAPTLFAFYSGLGPFSRLRHSITPVVAYRYAPAARADSAFLHATGRSVTGYVGARAQHRLSLGVSTTLEGKLRDGGSGAGGAGEKLTLLSLAMDAVVYDFARQRTTPGGALASEGFGIVARSDLVPGLEVAARYSLFAGSLLSDTARFRPSLDELRIGLVLGAESNPFTAIERVFGRAVPLAGPAGAAVSPRDSAETPAAEAPDGRGWHAAFAFSTTRGRTNGFVDLAGGLLEPEPPLTTLQAHVGMPLTRDWGAQWLTMYDFRERAFASHVLTLHRDLHDWRADFGFARATNGNVSFSMGISLKNRPEVNLDFSRNVIRAPARADDDSGR